MSNTTIIAFTNETTVAEVHTQHEAVFGLKLDGKSFRGKREVFHAQNLQFCLGRKLAGEYCEAWGEDYAEMTLGEYAARHPLIKIAQRLAIVQSGLCDHKISRMGLAKLIATWASENEISWE